RQLDAARWTPAKIGRRGAKYAAFAVLSLLVTHVFLAYFVSLPGLWGMMRAQPAEHWSAFLFVFLFAAVLNFNFVWFREQLCIVLCPYGRLQSALLDDDSLVIGYDSRRGEPRGLPVSRESRAGSPYPASAGSGDPALQRNSSDVVAGLGEAGAAFTNVLEGRPGSPTPATDSLRTGDCVACQRCVAVCPTGIDIRQGMQIECIGCAACIDACDEIMNRFRRPRGLV